MDTPKAFGSFPGPVGSSARVGKPQRVVGSFPRAVGGSPGTVGRLARVAGTAVEAAVKTAAKTAVETTVSTTVSTAAIRELLVWC